MGEEARGVLRPQRGERTREAGVLGPGLRIQALEQPAHLFEKQEEQEEQVVETEGEKVVRRWRR